MRILQGRRRARMGWMGGIPALNPARGALQTGPPPTLLRPLQPSFSSSPATSLQPLGCLLRVPSPNTGFEFPPGRSSGGAKPTPLCREPCGRRQRGLPVGGGVHGVAKSQTQLSDFQFYDLVSFLSTKSEQRRQRDGTTLWLKAQHEGALPTPCIVRKDPRVPHTARRGA